MDTFLPRGSQVTRQANTHDGYGLGQLLSISPSREAKKLEQAMERPLESLTCGRSPRLEGISLWSSLSVCFFSNVSCFHRVQ